jgi:3-dehydroquinate synthetase
LLSRIEETGTRRENLVPMIARNVTIKAAIVEEDERETAGVRALLNFGHTVGHGIENAAGYGRFLHGEAISLGLVAAARLSVAYGGLDSASAERLVAVLKQFDLPVTLASDLSRHDILDAMSRDKKFEEGEVRFVLLKSLGDAFVSAEVPLSAIDDAILTLYGP